MKTKLRRKRRVAHKTFGLELDRPAGFHFRPGDHVALEVIRLAADDPRGNWRPMSIASAPHDDHLLFTSREGVSPFKQTLAALAEGDELIVSDPSGAFVLPDEASMPLVFFAGGIGVTPFRSMIKSSVEQRLNHSITLFYANRRPEDAAFLDELDAWADANPRFKFYPVMTKPDTADADWTGPTGYFTPEYLAAHLKTPRDRLYYVAGTPRFVTGVQNVLLQFGVPKHMIKTDEFEGYI